MSGPIAIIAGEGALPVEIATSLSNQGRDFLLAEMEGHPAENPNRAPVIRFRVERMGSLFAQLHRQGVKEIVMAGAIHRPKLDPSKFDLKTVSLAPKLFSALRQGDDGALRAVVAIFEAEGFDIRAAHDFVPNLVLPPGLTAGPGLSNELIADATRGKAILDALAGQDVAQACVIAGGQCLGIESVYGTDALLKFVTDQRPNRRPETGGVLVKRPKTGQELRVDMPVIGISTIEAALAAKLSGVCLAAGQVMVLDCPAVASLCDREGISLWAI